MKMLSIVMDLQFGSTGKGLLCGWLSNAYNYDTVISAWGPNAGHTYIDQRGVKYVNTMLPIGALNPSVRNVLLGPGSVINLQSLLSETQFAVIHSGDRAPTFSLVIHPQAMVVRERHLEQEKQLVRIGSTMKGTGAALLEKIARDPAQSPLVRDAVDDPAFIEFQDRMEKIGIQVLISEEAYNTAIRASSNALLEGAQGFSLGLNRGFWPHTTSREITPAQMLSDCALPLPLSYGVTVYGCLRTYPIRVANRTSPSGKLLGTSGGVYRDQRELTWDELGLEPEYTTVTKLKRRVFSFSYDQLIDALRLCTPDHLFLNFCNYLEPRHGSEWDRTGKLARLVDDIDSIAADMAPGNKDCAVSYLGWGPNHDDVEEL